MTDFYISFLEDISRSPKTWTEIKQKYPNEHEAIWREVTDKHLLSQYSNGKYHLSFEARFKLLDYYELQEAKRAAKAANRNAFIAIAISAFAIVMSAVLTFTQSNTPIPINRSDLNALIKSNREPSVQSEVKLDSLQMAQILSAIRYDKPNTKAKKEETTNQGQEVSHHELINQYFEDQ